MREQDIVSSVRVIYVDTFSKNIVVVVLLKYFHF